MAREIKSTVPIITTSTSFDGKHILEFNESSHRYKLDKKPCTSTTTFCKAGYPMNIGLINWMKRQSSLALYNLLLQTTIVDGWPNTEEEKKELFKKAETAHEEVAQEAADIGTITHAFAELHSAGKIKEATVLRDQIKVVEKWPIIEGCLNKYLDWAAHDKGELILAEGLIASPTYLFCGKFDRLDKVNGHLRLRDYKTAKAFYPEQFIQLGAYTLAIREWHGLIVEELEVVRFGKEDGLFETLLITERSEIQAFIDQALRCRATFEFKKIENDPRFDWRVRGKVA